VYCGWLIVELVFVVTNIVETRGRTLEETAALFDGEESPQDLMQRGGEAATMSMGRATGIQRQMSEEKSRPVDRDILELSDLSSSSRRDSNVLFMNSKAHHSDLSLTSIDHDFHAV
jgi:hypothetical protein